MLANKIRRKNRDHIRPIRVVQEIIGRSTFDVSRRVQGKTGKAMCLFSSACSLVKQAPLTEICMVHLQIHVHIQELQLITASVSNVLVLYIFVYQDSIYTTWAHIFVVLLYFVPIHPSVCRHVVAHSSRDREGQLLFISIHSVIAQPRESGSTGES